MLCVQDGGGLDVGACKLGRREDGAVGGRVGHLLPLSGRAGGDEDPQVGAEVEQSGDVWFDAVDAIDCVEDQHDLVLQCGEEGAQCLERGGPRSGLVAPVRACTAERTSVQYSSGVLVPAGAVMGTTIASGSAPLSSHDRARTVFPANRLPCRTTRSVVLDKVANNRARGDVWLSSTVGNLDFRPVDARRTPTTRTDPSV